MPRISYFDPAGTRHDLELQDGSTVMEGAIDNGIEGVIAECGGACACATCHVYVDASWLDRLPPLQEMEEAMLDSVMGRQPTSRLSCQLEVSAELDGLIVHIAPNES